MNAIALTIILIVRVLIPLTVLLTLGEWVHRHEKIIGFGCEEPWKQ